MRPSPPVHPHGCGDHVPTLIGGTAHHRCNPTGVGTTVLTFAKSFRQIGSSPRVWGPPLDHVQTIRQYPVHPHGCGDHVKLPTPVHESHAVHPHGCGDHRLGNVRISSARRFIPTGVGTTSRAASMLPLPTVHPHGCGDHTSSLQRSERRSSRMSPRRRAALTRFTCQRPCFPSFAADSQ